jgi:hypothetical protein
MAKHYIELHESQFIVDAATPAEAVAKFIRRRIKQNRLCDALALSYWFHYGQYRQKRCVSFLDVTSEFSRGEWRLICFEWHRKRGTAFMDRFISLVGREVLREDFE